MNFIGNNSKVYKLKMAITMAKHDPALICVATTKCLNTIRALEPS